MNSVQLVGRLTADPEAEQYEKDDKFTSLARMRVAVPRPRQRDAADYVTVIAFGALGASCVDFLAKGRRVGITGRLRHSEWTSADGSKRSRLEVVADSVEFLDAPRKGGDEGDYETAAADANGEPF
ncbi:MAG: single-stranded DNA-binding protein [Dehalococcoidia bacterium]